MNLYRISVQHCGPKDSHKSVESYVMGRHDTDMYEQISKLNYGVWDDRNDERSDIEIFDNEYNVIGTETYKERIIRLKGDINDEDEDLSDLYYGCTLYGWENLGPISDSEEITLIELGVLNYLEEGRWR